MALVSEIAIPKFSCRCSQLAEFIHSRSGSGAAGEFNTFGCRTQQESDYGQKH
jgi:hypothetical protein